mmetsp:Transcript_9887/g.42040  ORF Transcript_9887/g.42040 Transcript_9887/m.42040 type:complete len:232 (+) Transcript_9887:1393-2088(+)
MIVIQTHHYRIIPPRGECSVDAIRRARPIPILSSSPAPPPASCSSRRWLCPASGPPRAAASTPTPRRCRAGPRRRRTAPAAAAASSRRIAAPRTRTRSGGLRPPGSLYSPATFPPRRRPPRDTGGPSRVRTCAASAREEDLSTCCSSTSRARTPPRWGSCARVGGLRFRRPPSRRPPREELFLFRRMTRFLILFRLRVRASGTPSCRACTCGSTRGGSTASGTAWTPCRAR